MRARDHTALLLVEELWIALPSVAEVREAGESGSSRPGWSRMLLLLLLLLLLRVR